MLVGFLAMKRLGSSATVIGLDAIHRLLDHYRTQELVTHYRSWYAQKIRPDYLAIGLVDSREVKGPTEE